MRNKYADYCYKCGKYVPVGYGFFERHWDGYRKWRVQCVECCDGRKVKDNDPEVERARSLRRKADNERR